VRSWPTTASARYAPGSAGKNSQAKGPRSAAPLGSTGTKNRGTPDTLYVDELIGPDTVNTLPPATLEAFLDHGKAAPTLRRGVREARQVFDGIEKLGIRLDGITDTLQREGVLAFETSFDALMASIRSKRDEIRAGWKPESTQAGSFREQMEEALAGSARIASWTGSGRRTTPSGSPTEGDLEPPRLAHERFRHGGAPRRDRGLREGRPVRRFTQVLLLGMGGSSLAPEVFAKTFGSEPGWPTLAVSTAPTRQRCCVLPLSSTRKEPSSSSRRNRGRPSRSIHSSSSFTGGPARGLAGRRPADTSRPSPTPDRNSRGLHASSVRQVFLNDPDIGGRFSALSFFGMVPAALIGFDVRKLLERA